jgi:hypothetical protein
MSKRTVIRLDDKRLIRIPVIEIVRSGWIKDDAEGNRLELFQVDDDHIALRVNGNFTDIRFKLAEQAIPDQLQHGARVPHDKSWIWYVQDEEGKKYRYLYLNQTTKHFGTRKHLGLRHVYNCLSRSQRAIYSAGLRIRRDAKRRRREERRQRQRDRQLAAYRLRMGMD